MPIFSLEIEKDSLSILLNKPDFFFEISSVINEQDYYSELNQSIFSVIKQISNTQESLTPTIIAQKLQNMGLSFEDDINVFDYLESLSLILVPLSSSVTIFKELKKYSVARKIYLNSQKIQKEIKHNINKTSKELLEIADKIHADNLAEYDDQDSPEDIFCDLEQVVEERGNNPQEEIGLMGPFDTINRIYGSLLRDGAITVIGARTGIGKTSFGFNYLTEVAAKYGDLPILHLDCGEMSKEELQFRATCMFSKGHIPFHALETGLWRKNQDFTDKLRKDVFPKVKKLQYYYYNVGGMTQDEVVNLIRRFYYQKIGKGKRFLCHYDYLKPFDVSDTSTPEWKEMGHFIQKIKTLITKEIPHMPFWTSLQLNKSGITGNKKSSEIDDTENTFSISDRIVQQTTHAAIMRWKTPEELANDGPENGNVKLIFVKHRHLGKDYLDALIPVKLPDGKGLAKNYINIRSNNFHFEDKGDFKTVLRRRIENINISMDGPNIPDSKSPEDDEIE